MPNACLSLEEVSYFAHLGCGVEEQKLPQEVKISITVVFGEQPPACHTDKLEDTVCYAQINQRLQKICDEKTFATIEALAFSCWEALVPLVHADDKLRIKIDKVRPPLSKTLKCASFTLEGQKPNA